MANVILKDIVKKYEDVLAVNKVNIEIKIRNLLYWLVLLVAGKQPRSV